MKLFFTLISLILLSPEVEACLNQIATSQVPAAVALTLNEPLKACGSLDPCVCYDGMIWKTSSWVDIAEPDFSKPKVKQDIQACTGPSDCQTKLVAKVCTDPTAQKLWAEVAGSDPLAYQLYCAAWQTKLVKHLVTDAAKVAAAATAKTAADAEAAAKLTKRTARLTALINCAKLTAASATQLQISACTIGLAREMLRDRLTAAEQ